jgi:hypothetical protein
MHPWMLEQVASEHRRDLLARAARPRVRPARTLRTLAAYMSMTRVVRRRAPVAPAPSSAPVLARLPGGNGIETGPGVMAATARTSRPDESARTPRADESAHPASAA